MQPLFSLTVGRLLKCGGLAGVFLGASLGILGCDTVPTPERSLQPPTVANLHVVPDSVVPTALPPEQVGDSTVQVPLQLEAQATDPDGTVARVVFLIEPASAPQATLSGTLPALPDRPQHWYGGGFALSLPLADEIYTVRVFAIDADSLASNQVTGQVRVVAPDSSSPAASSQLP
jgi:hypothetical protein